jgi:hypothetical protein
MIALGFIFSIEHVPWTFTLHNCEVKQSEEEAASNSRMLKLENIHFIRNILNLVRT